MFSSVSFFVLYDICSGFLIIKKNPLQKFSIPKESNIIKYYTHTHSHICIYTRSKYRQSLFPVHFTIAIKVLRFSWHGKCISFVHVSHTREKLRKFGVCGPAFVYNGYVISGYNKHRYRVSRYKQRNRIIRHSRFQTIADVYPWSYP